MKKISVFVALMVFFTTGHARAELVAGFWNDVKDTAQELVDGVADELSFDSQPEFLTIIAPGLANRGVSYVPHSNSLTKLATLVSFSCALESSDRFSGILEAQAFDKKGTMLGKAEVYMTLQPRTQTIVSFSFPPTVNTSDIFQFIIGMK